MKNETKDHKCNQWITQACAVYLLYVVTRNHHQMDENQGRLMGWKPMDVPSVDDVSHWYVVSSLMMKHPPSLAFPLVDDLSSM